MTGRTIDYRALFIDPNYQSTFNVFDKNIEMLRFTGSEIKNIDIRKFVEVIYRNFYELSIVRGSSHSKETIHERLNSRDTLIILAMNRGHIIGYLIAQKTPHQQYVLMHIYYIYTSPIFRNKGVATQMLNLIHKYSKELGYRIMSLTFDTYDMKLTKFYLDNNFTYDKNLRSYQRFDMLVKYI
jgi:ribosomal protein S18 acetylase RimI-like enzyme